MTNKYSIYYAGASGGFMFFWSLQLALGYDVKDSIDRNWDIQDVSKWKRSEAYSIHLSNWLNGIRLYCNAIEVQKDDVSILIYTDVVTQEKLARMKNAYWYRPNGQFKLGDIPINSYSDVKDSSWPTVNKLEDFGLLSESIRTELVHKFDFPEELSSLAAWKKNLIIRHNINGIDATLDSIFDKVDYKFLLQDVVDTKFKCVCDALGIEHTIEVEEHIDTWVALHPENIQKILHKTI